MNKIDMEPHIENVDYPYIDDVGKYEEVSKVGQGTFGEIFKARDKTTRNLVTFHKVLLDNEKEGSPNAALAEIKNLQSLDPNNIVKLLEIYKTKANHHSKSMFYFVFEFCDYDLAGLLSNYNVKFSLREIKSVIQQLLNGLLHLHDNQISHLDMKPANVLLTKEGVLKLAGSGLAGACYYGIQNSVPNRSFNPVVTLWYRPPELLLGGSNNWPAVDMWGAGCIIFEMWSRSPIMHGSTEQQQIALISQLCGSINPEVWPDVENFELYSKLELPKWQTRKVKERLKFYVENEFAGDLLDKLLTLDPSKRLDVDAALNNDFFWSDPMPCYDLKPMLQTYSESMFEYLPPPKGGRVLHHVSPQPRV